MSKDLIKKNGSILVIEDPETKELINFTPEQQNQAQQIQTIFDTIHEREENLCLYDMAFLQVFKERKLYLLFDCDSIQAWQKAGGYKKSLREMRYRLEWGNQIFPFLKSAPVHLVISNKNNICSLEDFRNALNDPIKNLDRKDFKFLSTVTDEEREELLNQRHDPEFKKILDENKKLKSRLAQEKENQKVRDAEHKHELAQKDKKIKRKETTDAIEFKMMAKQGKWEDKVRGLELCNRCLNDAARYLRFIEISDEDPLSFKQQVWDAVVNVDRMANGLFNRFSKAIDIADLEEFQETYRKAFFEKLEGNIEAELNEPEDDPEDDE